MFPQPQPRTSRALVTSLHGPRGCSEESCLPLGPRASSRDAAGRAELLGPARCTPTPTCGPVAPPTEDLAGLSGAGSPGRPAVSQLPGRDLLNWAGCMEAALSAL